MTDNEVRVWLNDEERMHFNGAIQEFGGNPLVAQLCRSLAASRAVKDDTTEVIAGKPFTSAPVISLNGDGPFTLECGGQLIEIDKLYGPLIACGLRIFLDRTKDRADWVVQRERISRDAEDNDVQTWEEVARFGCQESLHFDEGDVG